MLRKNRPLEALRALMALAQNPDDLARVFTVIDALPGRSPARTLRRMQACEGGRELLATRPNLRAHLSDRDALRRLPGGTLGRAYLELTEREGISADGIVLASEGSGIPRDGAADELAWTGDRLRDTHDLWHVVTGYGADLLGEASLLGFTYAQTPHPGILLVASLSVLRGLPGARQMIADGYARGKRAAWLPAVRWEDLLDRPLDDVRAAIGVEPVPAYVPITSAALREAGFLAPRAA